MIEVILPAKKVISETTSPLKKNRPRNLKKSKILNKPKKSRIIVRGTG